MNLERYPLLRVKPDSPIGTRYGTHVRAVSEPFTLADDVLDQARASGDAGRPDGWYLLPFQTGPIQAPPPISYVACVCPDNKVRPICLDWLEGSGVST